MCRSIVLAIGNELLRGDTQDTNTNWLCKHLTQLGATICYTMALPDKREIITYYLSQAFYNQIDLIVTTGGLGPTVDDLTLSAVGEACQAQLHQDDTAYQWVSHKYQELAAQGFVATPEISPARAKMAQLPTGSIPVANPIGVAPGILLKYQQSNIICLPGVPKEMQVLMLTGFTDLLKTILTTTPQLGEDIWVDCGDESILAPILSTIALAYPQTYIKSKAKHFGANVKFLIKLASYGDQATIQLAIVKQVIAEQLLAVGIRLIPPPTGIS